MHCPLTLNALFLLSAWLVPGQRVIVDANPETDGRHSIPETSYNNSSYTLKLNEHTDWSRKCP